MPSVQNLAVACEGAPGHHKQEGGRFVQSTALRLTWGAMMVALGILFPMAFHAVGLGRAFLPMHIPVLMCGLLTDPYTGLLVGALTPLLSALITGMPLLAPPVAQAMMVELGIYGFVASVLRRKRGVSVYPALLLTMAGGRLVYGLLGALAFRFIGLGSIPVLYPVTAGLLTGAPGVLLQLAIVPPVVMAAERSLASLRLRAVPRDEAPREGGS
jgi:uncharacterized membrane protein